MRRSIATVGAVVLGLVALTPGASPAAPLRTDPGLSPADQASVDAGLPVAEYGPNEVKIAVTGMGNADKEQVRRALVKVHGLKEVPTQADAADAVAVALTHLVGARMRGLARLGSR